MRKIHLNYIYLLLLIIVSSCEGIKGEGDGFSLVKTDIYGGWQMTRAKFEASANMTEWELDSTSFYFGENGMYQSYGYFGEVIDGSYSVSGNTITGIVDNKPAISFQINEIHDGNADVTATVLSNGKMVWMVWQKMDIKIEDVPPAVVTPSTYFNSEAELEAFISGIYFYISRFTENKISLEDKITSGDLSVLISQNDVILKLWEAAYRCLNMSIQALEALDESSFRSRYIPHILAIRAFIAYNLATMWGNVPYTTQPFEAQLPSTVKAEGILQSAVDDLEASLHDYSLENNNWNHYLNPSAAKALLGEIYLTLGRREDAKSCLVFDFDNPPLSTVDEVCKITWQGTSTLVYSVADLKLLQQEASGNTEGLVADKQQGNHYGYWQMLKRIGKAKEVCGCQDYQLLLPIPRNEIDRNPDLNQNPGY